MKTFAVTLLCGSALVSVANAADLSPAYRGQAPSYKAPMAAPVAARNWTGLYVGLNIGYGWGAGGRNEGGQTSYSNDNLAEFPFENEVRGTGGPAWNTSADLSGVVGGVQLGSNWQLSPWLVA